MKLIILTIAMLAATLTHAENVKIDDDKKTEKRGIYGSTYSGGVGGLYDGGLYSPSSYLTPGGLPRNPYALGLGGVSGYNSGLGYPSSALGYSGLSGTGGYASGLGGVGGYGSGLGGVGGYSSGLGGVGGYASGLGYNGLSGAGVYSGYNSYNNPLAYSGLGGLNGLAGGVGAGGYPGGYLNGYNTPGLGGYSGYSRVVGLQPTGANGGYLY